MTLVQCVRDIRRALEDHGQQYLKTVPRRGYIFRAPIHSNDGAANSAVDASNTENAAVAGKDAAISVETVTALPASLEASPRVRSLWPRIGVGLIILLGVAGFLGLYSPTKRL